MSAPNRREVRTALAPAPAFSYSQGIVVGELLFTAGQVPRHPSTGEVPTDFADQARQTLENLAAVARAAGTSLAHAVRVNVYLEDLDDVVALEDVYRDYFSPPFPARTTVRAGLRGYRIEVDAIVALEGGDPS